MRPRNSNEGTRSGGDTVCPFAKDRLHDATEANAHLYAGTGLKLLELLEPLKQTLNDGDTRCDMEELSRGTAGKRVKRVCDEKQSLRRVRGEKNVRVQKARKKGSSSSKRKWPEGVAQRRLEGCVSLC